MSNEEFINREKVIPGVGVSSGKPNSQTKPPKGLAHISGSSQAVTLSTISVKVLPLNKLRAYLLIQNKSPATIYVSMGTNIDESNFNAIEILAGGNYEPYTNGRHVIASDVYMKGTTGNQVVAYVEGLFIDA